MGDATRPPCAFCAEPLTGSRLARRRFCIRPACRRARAAAGRVARLTVIVEPAPRDELEPVDPLPAMFATPLALYDNRGRRIGIGRFLR